MKLWVKQNSKCGTNYILLHRPRWQYLDSSLTKLVILTAWFSVTIYSKTSEKKSTRSKIELKAEKINQAKMMWKGHVHESSFTSEINAIKSNTKNKLKNQRRLAKKESLILRCHARVFRQNRPETNTFPKLPPNNHGCISLAINSRHEKLVHGGLSHTLSYSYQKKILVDTGKNNSQTSSSDLLKMPTTSRGPTQNAPDGSIPTPKIQNFKYAGLEYLETLNLIVDGMWIYLFT